MSTSDVMDAEDRAKFARGGSFLLVGGLVVVALSLVDVAVTPSLYAGLVGASLALAVAAIISSEPVIRAVWFAPGVAAVGVGVADLADFDLVGVGGVLCLLGVVQLVTAGRLKDL
ncbi:hypothetical protein G9C85_18140 [Halorubellus sp. JP-L1]|uniref:hypothetical protein n=1 Tax=Halorubellus sp. JP-L1 TaxID=2715753 RepID=UPI00140C5960|nr:hypothetical protein [Halorubellus sp. JP-L1]NHN43542.1 hypothetical protein [Halorubellus sp. JP-L1]